jgi:hypothetical protein
MELLVDLIKRLLSLEGAERIKIFRSGTIEAYFIAYEERYHINDFSVSISNGYITLRLEDDENEYEVLTTNLQPLLADYMESTKHFDAQGEEYWETTLVASG